MRPPMRSRASSTTTVRPAWWSRSAAVSPAYPAPITQTSASTRSITVPPRPDAGRPATGSVLQLIQQFDELGARVGPVGGHDHAADAARRALDAEHDHLVAGVRLALEPEGVAHQQLRRTVPHVAGRAAHRAVGEGEVAAVAVGLEEGDGFGHGRGG